MFLNGDTDYQLNVKKGEVVRFFLTDSANTRIFNFSIDGHKMILVCGDGGKYQKESFINSVVIAPAERYIVEVLFDKAGTFKLLNTIPGKTRTLGVVNVNREPTGDGGPIVGQDFDLSSYSKQPWGAYRTTTDITVQKISFCKARLPS
jgi:FtsP/CotA-like multicopper oxidase with cupredoxin domain